MIGDLLEQVVPHPEYKLLTLQNIPLVAETSLKYSTFQWHGLLKHLRQMLVASAAMEEGIHSITTWIQLMPIHLLFHCHLVDPLWQPAGVTVLLTTACYLRPELFNL